MPKVEWDKKSAREEKRRRDSIIPDSQLIQKDEETREMRVKPAYDDRMNYCQSLSQGTRDHSINGTEMV